MKRGFSVIERAMVIQALPTEDNVLTLRIIKKIKEDMGFSEADVKEIKVDQKGDFLLIQTLPDKEIEIGERGVEIIGNAFRSLNDRKKLTENHLGLYEFFVENAPK
jgi:hypothetical protein